MEKTGVFATKDEVDMLMVSLKTPLIALQCGPRKSAQVRCHELALAHGLPEITGYYGIDEAGEFVTSD